jgi:hypothetical protein
MRQQESGGNCIMRNVTTRALRKVKIRMIKSRRMGNGEGFIWLRMETTGELFGVPQIFGNT